MMYEIDLLDCACPACGRINALPVPEAAVIMPLLDRCWHCGAGYAVTSIAIGIFQDTGAPEPTISVTATTVPG